MKQIAKTIWIPILFICFSSNLRAFDHVTADSTKVAQIVIEFYDWYLTSIQEREYSDFKPRFVESSNGMTTLDYSGYLDSLKTHGFSDSLIIKEKLSYSDCIENLGKIKYADFQKTIFTELDEYEQANCDFGNYYRWTGGQEPIDGIRINNVKFISKDCVMVAISYFDRFTAKSWGGNKLTLIKIDNVWLINEIGSWK